MSLRVNVVGNEATARKLLVLIHGYGADEQDLAPLQPYIDPSGRFMAACPRGPFDLDGGFGAAWYERTADGGIEPASLQGSILALDHTLTLLCEHYGFDRAEAALVGFSQGAAMALAVALRETTVARPAAVAALSGSLATPDWLTYAFDSEDAAVRAALPPVFVHHGTADPVVDVEKGRRTRDTLVAGGLDVTYHEYPMQHEISAESLFELRAWLDVHAP